jgi:ATP-dependent DNA helicase RecG
MPVYTIEKVYTEQLTKSHIGKIVTTRIYVEHIERAYPRSRRPSIVLGKCGKDVVEILLFNYASPSYLHKSFPQGQTVFISGKLCESYKYNFQFVNPERLASQAAAVNASGIFNIYPLTTGIYQNSIYGAMKSALKYLENTGIPEWLPSETLSTNNFSSFSEAIAEIHRPGSIGYSDLVTPARRRLCFDEVLAEQIGIRLSNFTDRAVIIIQNDKVLINKLLQILEFSLTNSQNEALGEILSDISSGTRMMRLLQGDVGSGKTIVAILAILYAVESGYQCAFLAPTEILARQHYRIIARYFDQLWIGTELLTANEKGKARQRILGNIETGAAKVLVGTHAILTESVKFQNLGLVIIDEQHRFGVDQRLQLIDKGNNPHILSMTATPIPRTMVMAFYGDIAVSSITEKPVGRAPITTSSVQISRLPEVLESIRKIIDQGQKVYWVCPLIEESTKVDYTCVINRFEYLKEYFPDDVQMLYGKMKSCEKQEIFQGFMEGRFHILVSTTVIEVGVDVQDATVMIIENAEKFGLSQLHQLRGRVGRGTLPSYCILVFDPKLSSKISMDRIRVIKSSNDGFYIAEKDLLLRGGGEIFGTRQSGQKKYRTFDINNPDNQSIVYETLKQTSKLAAEIVDQGNIDDYSILLKIFSTEKVTNIRQSF